jgi:hypothetical protein
MILPSNRIPCAAAFGTGSVGSAIASLPANTKMWPGTLVNAGLPGITAAVSKLGGHSTVYYETARTHKEVFSATLLPGSAQSDIVRMCPVFMHPRTCVDAEDVRGEKDYVTFVAPSRVGHSYVLSLAVAAPLQRPASTKLIKIKSSDVVFESLSTYDGQVEARLQETPTLTTLQVDDRIVHISHSGELHIGKFTSFGNQRGSIQYERDVDEEEIDHGALWAAAQTVWIVRDYMWDAEGIKRAVHAELNNVKRTLPAVYAGVVSQYNRVLLDTTLGQIMFTRVVEGQVKLLLQHDFKHVEWTASEDMYLRLIPLDVGGCSVHTYTAEYVHYWELETAYAYIYIGTYIRDDCSVHDTTYKIRYSMNACIVALSVSGGGVIIIKE